MLVILTEDKTKVMARVLWESHLDSLVGFNGRKDDHCCDLSFKPIVGNGDLGYETIVNAFHNYKIGSFARMKMVHLFYEKISQLVPSCIMPVQLF